MELLTSKKGFAHFTSAKFRTFVTAMMGQSSYIAPLYDELAPTLAANNTVNIGSGFLVHHGALILVPQGTYDEVTYQNDARDEKN